MARILITSIGSYGDVNPYLAIGHGLARRGHRVVFCTARPFRDDVLGAGLEYAPLGSEESMPDRAGYERIMDPVRGSEVVVREFAMSKLREHYADLEKASEGADLLLSHVITYFAPILAEKKKLRWISTVLSPMVFFSAYDPPVLPPAPWLRGLMEHFSPSVNRAILRSMQRISHGWSEPARELRRDLGLPPGEDPLFEGQHSPHGVLCHFPAFLAAPQPDWPPQARMCGFPFYDRDVQGRNLNPRLERFIRAGRPPVVFSFGSSAVEIAERLYERAIEAAESSGLRAVLLAGRHADELARRVKSPDVIVLPSASYAWLFPKCSAIVHQAGIGTLAQALRSGKPMLMIPFAHDQFHNAHLAQRLGVGTAVFQRDISARALAAHVERILNDARMASSAAEAGKKVREDDGVRNACDAIEETFKRE